MQISYLHLLNRSDHFPDQQTSRPRHSSPADNLSDHVPLKDVHTRPRDHVPLRDLQTTPPSSKRPPDNSTFRYQNCRPEHLPLKIHQTRPDHIPVRTIQPRTATAYQALIQIFFIQVRSSLCGLGQGRLTYRALDESCKAYYPHTFGLKSLDFILRLNLTVVRLVSGLPGLVRASPSLFF